VLTVLVKTLPFSSCTLATAAPTVKQTWHRGADGPPPRRFGGADPSCGTLQAAVTATARAPERTESSMLTRPQHHGRSVCHFGIRDLRSRIGSARGPCYKGAASHPAGVGFEGS